MADLGFPQSVSSQPFRRMPFNCSSRIREFPSLRLLFFRQQE